MKENEFKLQWVCKNTPGITWLIKSKTLNNIILSSLDDKQESQIAYQNKTYSFLINYNLQNYNFKVSCESFVNN